MGSVFLFLTHFSLFSTVRVIPLKPQSTLFHRLEPNHLLQSKSMYGPMLWLRFLLLFYLLILLFFKQAKACSTCLALGCSLYMKCPSSRYSFGSLLLVTSVKISLIYLKNTTIPPTLSILFPSLTSVLSLS